METFKKLLNICLRDLSSKLKIDREFVGKIHDEKNSWSFISKLAQLIEGFFTQILVQRLDEQDIYKTISNLPQAVRLNLAYELKIINMEEKLLFLTIAEIRNDYIHNISNIDVSLLDYFKTLKNSRKTEIYKRFKPFIKNEEISTSEEFFLDCKNSIFVACMLAISRVHGEMEGYLANRKHAEFRAKQAEQLLPQKADDAPFMEDKWMVIDFIRDAKNTLRKSGLLIKKFSIKSPDTSTESD